MRPHVFGTTAGSVLMIALLVGCAGNAAPPEADVPASPAPTTATVAPSQSVALQEPHTFVFSATGTAAVISVTYELDGRKTTDKSVSLPWRKVVDVPADGRRHTWSLTMKHRSGRVELFGIKDGTVTGRASNEMSGGTGTGTAEVSGDFRG